MRDSVDAWRGRKQISCPRNEMRRLVSTAPPAR